MDKNTAIVALNALAQSTRFDALALLVTTEPDGLAAGDIARRLAIPQNTMSSHLATLARAGLVLAERRSRNIIYRADPAQLSALTSFIEKCCQKKSKPKVTRGKSVSR